MRKSVYLIGVICLLISFYFSINITLCEFTDNELRDQRFMLATSAFMTLVCWLMYMIDSYETKN